MAKVVREMSDFRKKFLKVVGIILMTAGGLATIIGTLDYLLFKKQLMFLIFIGIFVIIFGLFYFIKGVNGVTKRSLVSDNGNLNLLAAKDLADNIKECRDRK